MNLAVMLAAEGVPSDGGRGDDDEAATGAMAPGERDVHGSDHTDGDSVDAGRVARQSAMATGGLWGRLLVGAAVARAI